MKIGKAAFHLKMAQTIIGDCIDEQLDAIVKDPDIEAVEVSEDDAN